jgi:hypothetical protein
LDGRLKTALTATQQAAATALGIGTNIPNATNRMLTQTGSLLATGGSNTTTIAQVNLPNVTLTSSTDGSRTHTHNAPGGNGIGLKQQQELILLAL